MRKNFLTPLMLVQLTAVTLLLLGLTACNGPSQSNKPSSESKPTSTTVAVLDRNIRSIFQASNGIYWIGTNGAGAYRYDGKTLTQYTVKDGLADNQVINIQEDDKGNIFFGSGTFAISKYDGNKFTTLTNKVKITNGTEADWKSKNSDLWFYAGGGVLRQGSGSLDYLPLAPSSSIVPINAPFSLSRYGVYSILKDKKGNVWIGTQAEGVCKYDGKKLTWLKEKGLAGPAVLGIFEDSKGRLWFGNNGAGLFLYDGKTLTNITEAKGLNNADFRASGKPGEGSLARVYSINEDFNGHIWIGTVDSGVWKYDGSSLTNYTMKDGLTSNAVNTIYKDRNGELWYGTDSNGIFRFNGRTFSQWSSPN
jgi:ligand-binding sensor domain-containing protein